MKDRLNKMRIRTESGQPKKIISFVAPTKILVQQQRKYIAANCDAATRCYTGETKSPKGKKIYKWGAHEWKRELCSVDIMVCTPEILRQILQRNLMPVSYFDCVVLDECHHAFGKHPMAVICEIIKTEKRKTGHVC